MTTIADRLAADTDGRLLKDLLGQQHVLCGLDSVTNAVSSLCSVISLPRGQLLIRQGDGDNDVYFILTGAFRILVNEREVALRKAGQHVGEMALIDPSSPRTASVVACEDSVVVKVTEAQFTSLANAHPLLWRNLAVELVRRLDERRKFHRAPNTVPQLFIGSSREGLTLAKVFASSIPQKVAEVRLWSEGVFGASHFPMEDLAVMLQCSDFAALLATGDDSITSRGKDSLAPRDNVVFELGLFMGAISRHRTFLILPRAMDVKIPTDLLGINPVYYDATAPDISIAIRAAAGELVAAIERGGAR